MDQESAINVYTIQIQLYTSTLDNVVFVKLFNEFFR